MAMSPEDWEIIRAKLAQMEQTVEALKKLRLLTFPDSVVRAIDSALARLEEEISRLKKATMADQS